MFYVVEHVGHTGSSSCDLEKMNSVQNFGAQNVFYVVEHGRDEELKPKEAGVKRPECKLCARNVFYVVEHKMCGRDLRQS